MVANNVANASTGGYKADREFYSLYVAPEAEGGDPDSDSTMPVIERPWTDLSQGTLQTTGNALDVALSGSGFFTVEGPRGPYIPAMAAFAWRPTASSPPAKVTHWPGLTGIR